jgi:hypothetical protein
MLTANEILRTLDNCDENDEFNFITLEHPYVHLIDCRLNVFRNSSDKWAIVSEVLGCNTRGYTLSLQIRYFGNCLINLQIENGRAYNYYQVFPVDLENFNETIDDISQSLKPNANFWIVRGTQVPLSHNKQDYLDAGILLKEYEPNEISGEEVGRLVVQKHRDLFRATDDELYKSIPKDLDKVLVINEWYHKEFHQSKSPFKEQEILNSFDLSNELVKNMIQQELDNTKKWNLEQWNNRPSSYETWQQIASVIVTGDTSMYKPTQMANSHWKNWPEGGSL